jgi:hypothetical protein
MIRDVTIGLAVVALATQVATAQAPAAGQPTTIAQAVQRGYANIKNNLTQAADKLSDADYTFKPSSMAEVRTFGQLFAHVANAQYGTCAAVKGVPNPNQGKNLENDLKTKAEFVKALADSFAFCDDAYSSLSDANANDMITQGRGPIARAALLMNNVVHNNEMYGTAAVYLRAKNVVPPSTENAAAARGAGGGAGRGGPAPAGRGTP